jgi:hypothetical protein
MSIAMLRDKIFGSFIDDTEFRLVMHAAAPLYVDAANFDADRALERARGMVVNAVAHSELFLFFAENGWGGGEGRVVQQLRESRLNKEGA